MILISNLILYIEDGSTVASTEIYGADKKTYINIGSGNVFKLHWETPTLANEIVDHYSLVIKRHDTTLNVYYDIYNKNIGLINNFYVDSSILPTLPEQYMLSIYVVAYYKSGNVITSNVVNPYVSKGSGTYIRVKEENYEQPIMKRALAFTRTPVLDDVVFAMVKNEDGGFTSILDSEGNSVQPKATRILESESGWNVMQEGYTKNSNGTWQANDIKYEMLQVLNEDTGKFEVLMDTSNTPVYVL